MADDEGKFKPPRREHGKCESDDSNRGCRKMDLDIAANLPEKAGWSLITPDGWGVPNHRVEAAKSCNNPIEHKDWEEIPWFSSTADGMLTLMWRLQWCDIPYRLELDPARRINGPWVAYVGKSVKMPKSRGYASSRPVWAFAACVWGFLASPENRKRFNLQRNPFTMRKFDEAKCPKCGGDEMYLVNDIRMQWDPTIGFCPNCNQDFAAGGDPEHAEFLRRRATLGEPSHR